MKRLILTTDGTSAGAVINAGRADLVIPIVARFVWGPPLSDAELTAMLVARTTQKPGSHWLDFAPSRIRKKIGGKNIGLVELCRQFDTVELWSEPGPNNQLVVVWLLDHFRSHANVMTNLVMSHVDTELFETTPKQLAKWSFLLAPVTNDHFEIARLVWQAWRAPTPEPWYNLLRSDLSLLPQLRRCVLELLDELPGRFTGLGATELRLLELISVGYKHPFDVFPHYRFRLARRVFDYWEVGSLLEGLALAPEPAVSGLAEWPFAIEMHDLRERYERYKASRLSLTALGKAILMQAKDFSRHNPIHRWWGGTELTNDRLWRCDPALVSPPD